MIRKEWLRGATVGLALAAGLTFASTNRAGAETAAETYLRDKTLCWTLESLNEGTGTWSHVPYSPDVIRGDSPEHTDGYFYLQRYRTARPNTTDPSSVSLVHSANWRHPSVRLRQIPCPPTPGALTPGGIHPFFGLEVGGGWSTTRFNVDPPFNVNGSGFVSGINGGFLIPLPGSLVSLGPRIGVQGNFFSGTTSNPIASPGFDYTVKNDWMAYQEAMAMINFTASSYTGYLIATHPLGVQPRSFAYLTAGIAEGTTRIQGATPGFSVTDNFTWVGPTFSAGFGVPLYSIIPPGAPVLGGTPYIYTQYRATWAGQNSVNIPGRVETSAWFESINFGLQIRY